MADLLSQIKVAIGNDNFDPTGKCGNCIDKLILIAHAGNGIIVLGDNDVINGKSVTGKNLDEHKKVKKNLKAIGGLFCETGKMVVHQCFGGHCPVDKKKQSSAQTLANLIGVTVEGYSGKTEGDTNTSNSPESSGD